MRCEGEIEAIELLPGVGANGCSQADVVRLARGSNLERCRIEIRRMLANQIADVLTKPRYVPAHDLDRKIAGKLQKLISVWHRQFTRLGLKAFPGASSHRWLGAAIVCNRLLIGLVKLVINRPGLSAANRLAIEPCDR